jgi:hypothetical protein
MARTSFSADDHSANGALKACQWLPEPRVQDFPDWAVSLPDSWEHVAQAVAVMRHRVIITERRISSARCRPRRFSSTVVHA